jgi:hypothetical protein
MHAWNILLRACSACCICGWAWILPHRALHLRQLWARKSSDHDIDEQVETLRKTYLPTVFGYTDFRPGQQDVIRKLLNGQHCLAVLPTGNARSACSYMRCTTRAISRRQWEEPLLPTPFASDGRDDHCCEPIVSAYARSSRLIARAGNQRCAP